MKSYKDIDEHILEQPKDVQKLLRQLRALIKKTAPGATETISYGIPTFDLHGKHLVHFAAYNHHIGFYPTPSGVKNFEKELSKYQMSKGTVQFPLNKALPLSLVTKIVKSRVDEVTPKSEFPKLSAPASRALANAKIKTLKDLSRWTENDLLGLHGIGPGSLPVLRAALKAKGFSFKK